MSQHEKYQYEVVVTDGRTTWEARERDGLQSAAVRRGLRAARELETCGIDPERLSFDVVRHLRDGTTRVVESRSIARRGERLVAVR